MVTTTTIKTYRRPNGRRVYLRDNGESIDVVVWQDDKCVNVGTFKGSRLVDVRCGDRRGRRSRWPFRRIRADRIARMY